MNQRVSDQILHRLADLLGVSPSGIRLKSQPSQKATCVDLLATTGNLRFAVEWKASGDASAVASAIKSLQAFTAANRDKLIPVVVVPFMGEVGSRLCAEAQLGWMDLSGNAHLNAPGLRVNIEGKPNQFKRVGRPRSVFAPKSARITRQLLMQPDQAFKQRELANVSGLDEGFTSRIIRQLEGQHLVQRDSDGAIRVVAYDTLLDAWREAYDFSKHQIVRGHIAARSSDEVLRQLSGQFRAHKLQHAGTALAGAWLWSGFAGFRLVVVYVADLPNAELRQAVGFNEIDRGENVWLVLPNDAGVFQGASEREHIPCVHPVQIYMDLKNHPERSAEAAEVLRKEFLKPQTHA